MRQFWAGVGAGSIVVAGLVVVAWSAGVLAFAWPFGHHEIVVASVALEDEDDGDAGTELGGRGRRRRGRRGGGSGSGGAGGSDGSGASDDPRAERPQRTPRGEATTGDDIGEPGARTIDMEGTGGEQQLSDAQVDGAFDRAFPRMRRCLTLAAGDEEVHGRVAFTVRIAPSGRVGGVRLSGPAAVTTGEAGDCLRGAARGISFPSFDGPEMTVRWHLTLD